MINSTIIGAVARWGLMSKRLYTALDNGLESLRQLDNIDLIKYLAAGATQIPALNLDMLPKTKQCVLSDQIRAYHYVYYILGKRWPEAEEVLKTSKPLWDCYNRNWPE